MLQHSVSASTAHPAPSLLLVAASETSSGVGLIVPQATAGHIPTRLAAHQDAIFPAATAFEIIPAITLLFTLAFMMGGLVKTRLSPS